MNRRAPVWLTLACALALYPLAHATPGATSEPGQAGDGADAPVQTGMTLAEDGAWGYNGPHAVISDGKLFWSYLDTDGLIWAASYDAESDEMRHNVVWDESDPDLHQASSLFVRPDGRIQVFINQGAVYNDKRIYWKVSEEPNDISAFGPLQESAESEILQGRQYYPLVHEPSGRVYLILNGRVNGIRRLGMWRSTDGGDTFDEHYVLYSLADDLQGNRSYTRAFIRDCEIHLAAVRVGWTEPLDDYEIGRVEGVYYIKYDINEQAFFRADGARAFDLDSTPVHDVAHFDEVWCWERHGESRQRAIWCDIVADEAGTPYMAFAVQDAVPKGESALHDGYWATPDENGQWRSHKVATLARGWDNTPERKNYAIAIAPENPETVFVSESTDATADLSQVRRMITPDHGVTWESAEALSREGRVTTVVVPWRTDGAPSPIEVLWLEGRMEGWRDYDTRIMAHGEGSEP